MKLLLFYLICHFSLILALPHHLKKDTDTEGPIKHGHSRTKILDCDGMFI